MRCITWGYGPLDSGRLISVCAGRVADTLFLIYCRKGGAPVAAKSTEAGMSAIRTLSQNIRWGVAYGVLFAAVLSGLVIPVAFARGALTASRMWLVIATYFASGVSAGLVVGLMREWTRRTAGALLVGLVAAVPVGIALQLAYDTAAQRSFSWLMLVEFAIIAGPLGGWIRWNQTWGPANNGFDPGRT